MFQLSNSRYAGGCLTGVERKKSLMLISAGGQDFKQLSILDVTGHPFT